MLRRLTIPLLLLGGLTTGTWWALDALRPHARWLGIEAPRYAVAGETLNLRIEILVPMTGALHVDLHGSTAHQPTHGRISSGVVTPESDAPNVFHAVLPVPADVISPHVSPVLFISPNRTWRDRIHAAYSARVVVRPPGTAPATGTRRINAFLPTSPIPQNRATVPEMNWAWRGTIAGLWLLCAGLCHRVRGSTSARWLMAGCLALAMTTLLPFGAELGDIARRLARDHDVYEQRTGFQTAATTALIVSAIALLGWMLRRSSGGARLAWCGIFGYAGFTAVSFLSLHELDALFVTAIAGVPTLRWIQLAATALALAGCGWLQRRRSAKHESESQEAHANARSSR